MKSSYKSKPGVQRIWRAARYSFDGFAAAYQNEAAFRQELLLVIVLAPCAFFVGRTPAQVMLLLASLLIILVVELFNSAIEALADAVSLEQHPLLGRAKDMGSAAVLLTLCMVALVWFSVLLL